MVYLARWQGIMKALAHLRIIGPVQRVVIGSTIITSLIVAASAAVYRDYDGPHLSRKQVAILKLRGDISVTAIDGHRLSTPVHGILSTQNGLVRGAHIELLPGQHELTFQLIAQCPSDCTHNMTLVAQAGKTYKAYLNTDGASMMTVSGRRMTVVSHFNKWWVEIK
jgi:hypothetical protein